MKMDEKAWDPPKNAIFGLHFAGDFSIINPVGVCPLRQTAVVALYFEETDPGI
jgi:hypothetical protein